uniref:Uncharacterized protein n=1 Tax=Quercus lobata TaxID=97700 RepID=A0A7N2QZS1_QUELO
MNLASQGEDQIASAFTNDGDFFLRTTYNAAKGLNALNPTTSSLSWIWKLKVPPKLVLFISLCSYNSIPIEEVLGSRGLDQRCSIWTFSKLPIRSSSSTAIERPTMQLTYFQNG